MVKKSWDWLIAKLEEAMSDVTFGYQEGNADFSEIGVKIHSILLDVSSFHSQWDIKKAKEI